MTNRPNWPTRRLKFLATLNDDALPEDTEPDYELLYIDIGNVDSLGRIHDIAPYRFEAAPSRARRRVADGDVIISTVRTYLEAIAPITEPPENLVVSTGFAVVRPKSNELDPDFCKYALRERQFMHEVVARSTGISYPAINASDLADIELPVPPINAQRRIAVFLDLETERLDKLIVEKQRQLNLLAEKRRTLISKAVTQGLNPNVSHRDSEIPWLGKIPVHWNLIRARYLFSESGLPVRPEDQMVTCFRDGVVTLRSNRRESGFTNGVLELGYQGIRVGQLVLHSMDAFAGAIGVSDSDGKCSPEYVICDPMTDKTNSPYYAFLLREMALRNFVQASCPAVRERAPRIRFNEFKDFWLPVPSIAEQQVIATYIQTETRKIDDFARATGRTIALLQERRSALISAAVTGQLEVKGASA